jgi:hypothetical protein
MGHGQLPRLVVCALDDVDAMDAVLVLARLDEYDNAVCATSSSRSSDTVFVVFVAVVDEPAVATVLGACAANHAPRPRKDAALTAPVIRRARRAGCGFFDVLMV